MKGENLEFGLAVGKESNVRQLAFGLLCRTAVKGRNFPRKNFTAYVMKREKVKR